MSFVAPFVLLLLLPLGGLLVLAVSIGPGHISRLPGKWQQTIAANLRGYVALRSNLGRAGTPILCFLVGALVIFALARPGLDSDDTNKFATLAGRVVILDVGSDLARHRQFIDALHRADPGVSTAVIASSGDAYRVVPFATDKSQIDRYVRVLNASIMPKPGQNPHLALAQAERILTDAGFLIRQIVLVTARQAPTENIEIPPANSRRFVVGMGDTSQWQDWATVQDASLLLDNAVVELTQSLRSDALAAVRSELPSARQEFTTLLIGFAALLWLLMFRRRSS